MGFGWAGLYFWDELPGRLSLLGKRFRTMGGPDCEKVSLCHLYQGCELDRFLIEFKFMRHLQVQVRVQRFLFFGFEFGKNDRV